MYAYPKRFWAQPDWAYEFPGQIGRTPKFARQVLSDRTESGLIFLNILPYKETKKKYGKKIEKDRTPKFAGQVLLHRTEFGLILLKILPYKETKKNIEKIFFSAP